MPNNLADPSLAPMGSISRFEKVGQINVDGMLICSKISSKITLNQTLASQGIDSNFEGQSSLESLMPCSRQGEF